MEIPNNSDAEPGITVALVERVSQRLAMGIPLRIALAGEQISMAEYQELLRERPELSVQEDLAKRRFLEQAMNTLLNGENAAANLRWLIELVYIPLITSPSEGPPKHKPGTVVLGMTDEELQQFQDAASRL